MAYRVKSPWILRDILYRKLVWRMPTDDKPAVYLTFDDGPHPIATPFVLDTLKGYNAKATFFCIGKNVDEQPEIYRNIQEQGHTIGNHTQNHLNGWKTDNDNYIKNVDIAARKIKSNLFRPPYGRITRGQIKALRNKPYIIYMWDVLSGDFDTNLTPEQCLKNVLNNIEPGSIIVFHDSEKAWPRMCYALPEVLKYCTEKNWQLRSLPNN
jgi:peptidoglycan/xylan/chitin deacetylase (PgdA/CDA1 family)